MKRFLQNAGAVALRQYYLTTSSPARIVPIFLWVLIEVLIWGFVARYLDQITAQGFDFTTVLLGAVMLWEFNSRVMQGFAIGFFEEIWSRNFLNLFATPLTVTQYLTGLVLTTTATSAIGLAVMATAGGVIFGVTYGALGWRLIPYLLVLFMFGVSLGVFGSAVVFRLGPAAEWFIWPIPGIIAPYAGVFYPLDTLPVWMQYVGRLLPPSYVFEGMRAVVRGEAGTGPPLWVGLALALGFLALSFWVFGRVHRYAVANGLLARYSAENVT